METKKQGNSVEIVVHGLRQYSDRTKKSGHRGCPADESRKPVFGAARRTALQEDVYVEEMRKSASSFPSDGEHRSQLTGQLMLVLPEYAYGCLPVQQRLKSVLREVRPVQPQLELSHVLLARRAIKPLPRIKNLGHVPPYPAAQ